METRQGRTWSRHAALAGATFLALAQLGCEAAQPLPPEVPQNPPGDPPPQAEQPAQVDPSASATVAVDDFTAPLAKYGAWIEDPRYGRVWKPSEETAGRDFTPYGSDGSWVANEDGGWVFESTHDNDWGWATYHYGRWLDVDGSGWVWVPGTVWAPSWVEWRYGGGYVGWVPMGPPGVIVAENRWVFVEERRFPEHGVLAHRLPPERIHSAFGAAAPVVEVRGAAHWTVGPPVAQLRAAGAPVRSVRAVAPTRAGQAYASPGAGARPAAPVAHQAAPPAPRPAPIPSPPPAAHPPAHAQPHAVPAATPVAAPKPRPATPAPAPAARPKPKRR